jgi:hypothetical protein
MRKQKLVCLQSLPITVSNWPWYLDWKYPEKLY